jgi:hypothetical protein
VPVSLEGPTPVDLGQPPQPLRVDQLGRTLELGEVLLDASIRQPGFLLAAPRPRIAARS